MWMNILKCDGVIKYKNNKDKNNFIDDYDQQY